MPYHNRIEPVEVSHLEVARLAHTHCLGNNTTNALYKKLLFMTAIAFAGAGLIGFILRTSEENTA